MQRIALLKPYAGNARTHSKKQIKQIASIIQRFGFTNPVLVSNEGEIIAGHGRVLAAKEMGITTVPTLKISHLSAAERCAYVQLIPHTFLVALKTRSVLALVFEEENKMSSEKRIPGFQTNLKSGCAERAANTRVLF